MIVPSRIGHGSGGDDTVDPGSLVRLLVAMDGLLVAPQRGLLSGSVITTIALVRLDAGVDTLVVVEAGPLGEGLVTLVALVGLRTGVQAKVGLQVGR